MTHDTEPGPDPDDLLPGAKGGGFQQSRGRLRCAFPRRCAQHDADHASRIAEPRRHLCRGLRRHWGVDRLRQRHRLLLQRLAGHHAAGEAHRLQHRAVGLLHVSGDGDQLDREPGFDPLDPRRPHQRVGRVAERRPGAHLGASRWQVGAEERDIHRGAELVVRRHRHRGQRDQRLRPALEPNRRQVGGRRGPHGQPRLSVASRRKPADRHRERLDRRIQFLRTWPDLPEPDQHHRRLGA